MPFMKACKNVSEPRVKVRPDDRTAAWSRLGRALVISTEKDTNPRPRCPRP